MASEKADSRSLAFMYLSQRDSVRPLQMKSPFQLRFSLCFVSASRLRTVFLVSLFLGVVALSLPSQTHKHATQPRYTCLTPNRNFRPLQ
jgi:hypothetical protein